MTRSIAPTEWNRPPGAHMCTVLEGLKRAAQLEYPIRALTMQNSPVDEEEHPDQLLIDIDNPRFMPLAEQSLELGKAALKCLIHIGDASRLYGLVSLGGDTKTPSYHLVGFPTSEGLPNSETSKELKPHFLQRLPFSTDIMPDGSDRRLTIMPVGSTINELLLTYNGAGYADIFAVEQHEGQLINLVEPQLWAPLPLTEVKQ